MKSAYYVQYYEIFLTIYKRGISDIRDACFKLFDEFFQSAEYAAAQFA